MQEEDTDSAATLAIDNLLLKIPSYYDVDTQHAPPQSLGNNVSTNSYLTIRIHGFFHTPFLGHGNNRSGYTKTIIVTNDKPNPRALKIFLDEALAEITSKICVFHQ
jgi:hypothetical protein